MIGGKQYVITIMDNENSVSAAKRTINSAKKFGMGKVEHWKATTPADNPEKIMKEKGIDPNAFKERYSRHENCQVSFLQKVGTRNKRSVGRLQTFPQQTISTIHHI